jgi:hypothetical protein
MRNEDRCYSFVTDFGEFTISRKTETLTVKTDKSSEKISLSDIDRLNYSVDSKWAWKEEFFMGSFILVDRINWHIISLRLCNGMDIPLFAIGQYEPREPFMRSVFNLQAQVLARFGLFHDVAEVATETLELIRSTFIQFGKSLKLV